MNISKSGDEYIGMDFLRRDIFVQFDDKDKVICNVIITGGINSPKSITSGLAPGTLPRTFPATFSGLFNVDIADYLFVLTYEPDLNDDLYLIWGEYPPVRLILAEDE